MFCFVFVFLLVMALYVLHLVGSVKFGIYAIYLSNAVGNFDINITHEVCVYILSLFA